MSGSAEMEMQMQMEMQMGFGPSTGGSSTSPLVRPIGISPSVDMTDPGEWFQGNRWPPLGLLEDQTVVTGQNRRQITVEKHVLPQSLVNTLGNWFEQAKALPALPTRPMDAAAKAPKPGALPTRQWSAQNYAIAVLGEFVQAAIAIDGEGGVAHADDKPAAGTIAPPPLALRWDNIDLNPSLLLAGPCAIKDELQQLARLMDYRPNVLDEALAQREGIDTYFRGIMTFSQASHPWTFGLMQIALRTGELQAMHYKYRFNRPRASTLLPWLMPPIEVPRHASYPSGHSTQSHLVALILGEVMPDWARGVKGPLRLLAQRIARNREVLGLHYPSDSAAGEKLAVDSFLLLRTCPTVRAIIDEARQEWGTDGRKGKTSLAHLGYTRPDTGMTPDNGISSDTGGHMRVNRLAVVISRTGGIGNGGRIRGRS